MSHRAQPIAGPRSRPQPGPRCSPGPTDDFVPFLREELEQSLPERFERQAARHPDRVAVKGRRRSFTYDALNRCANRVARAILAGRGEGEDVIGLLFEKDAPMVAALLGILKAGKLYVPLDPTHPAPRTVRMLDDGRATLIVTDDANCAAARELAQGRRGVLNVDALDAGLSESNLGRPLPPDTLAYVIYTSGSTGAPKGVAQNHRNVLHNTMRHTNALRISPDDRLTLLASMGTAQAATDIYSAVLNGATLLPFDVKQEGLSRLADWLRAEAVSIYHSSASIFRHLLDGSDRGEFPHVRVVKLGSEQVFKTDVDLYRRHFSPGCIFVNALSSTEAGVMRQVLIGQDTAISRRVVPVGFPVDDMEVLLLDEAGRPVPADRDGEIVIRSRYLAPGYWGKPELTRAAFPADPRGGGARIYRTGDVGRMSPDGCLEYLGRKDLQVKIRGFRIEVAEVEAALLERCPLKQAVVVARGRETGEARLEAYVVPAANAAPTVTSVRASLGEALPAHMVPARFFTLDALPLTPGGKVDRGALSSASALAPMVDASYVPPRSPLEWQLAKIWEDLLEVRPIGAEHDFFELGGDSLLALRMMDRIEAACGVRAPLSLLFAGPTVRRLARALLDGGVERFRSPLIEVHPGAPGSIPFFFLHGDYNGGGFYCRSLAQHVGPEQTLCAIQPHGLDGERIPRTIEAMAEDRLRVLLEYRPTGPYRLGGHCNGGLVAFEMARRMRRMGLAVDVVVMVDASASNARHRWLRRLIEGVGVVFRLKRHERMDWFISARRVLLRGASARDARRTAGILIEKIRRRVGTTGAPAARRPRDEQSWPGGLSQPEKDFAFHRAVDGYVPGPYRGRIVLLRTDSMLSRTPGDPSIGWRHVNPDVEVHAIPGAHMTCLTEHVESLARCLAGCLRDGAADPGSRTSPARVRHGRGSPSRAR